MVESVGRVVSVREVVVVVLLEEFGRFVVLCWARFRGCGGFGLGLGFVRGFVLGGLFGCCLVVLG